MFYPTISCSEAHAMVAKGAQLVDVRPPQKYRQSALPGSINIPLDCIQQALRQLDKNTPVLVYCNSGQLSGTARRLLEACGFSQVHNLGTRSFYNNCGHSR